MAAPALPGQIGDPKGAFLAALGRFSLELDGAFGDEGGRLDANLQALNEGIAQWNAAIGGFKAAMAAEIAGAEPAQAGQMHLALGGRT
jgi:hypothetical protein